jgi:putative membrane protein
MIAIQLWFLLVTTLLWDLLPIRLKVVPEQVKHAHARQLAHREFNALSGAGKQHRILLFVSLGERYVEVVADHETHALAPVGAWNKIVDEFLATVKDGRVADGVLGAAAACGDILKTNHPLSS